MFVIVNGTGGAGKDEFVKQCIQYIQDKGYSEKVRVIKKSIIDPVKELARNMNWQNEKTEKARRFLSDLKDLWDSYNGDLLNIVLEEAKKNANRRDVLEFMDMRTPREIETVKTIHSPLIRTVLVDNPSVRLIASNHADAGVFRYDYDYVIKNDGDINALYEKAGEFIESLFEYYQIEV